MISIFDPSRLSVVLDAIVPGIGRHISLIKFELLSPSLSFALIRTVGYGEKEHFFVCVFGDEFQSLQEVDNLIEEWHGKVLEYIKPVTPAKKELTDLDKITSIQQGCRVLLARVTKPSGHGYWATFAAVMPGESISEKLAHLSVAQREEAVAKLKDVLVSKVRATESFLNNYKTKQIESIELGDINTSELAATVYISTSGKQEIFYSRAETADTTKNKSRKSKVDRISRRGK